MRKVFGSREQGGEQGAKGGEQGARGREQGAGGGAKPRK